MNWVQINNRLLELEKKEWLGQTLTKEEVKEWNKLLDRGKNLGILKRNKRDEKNIGQTKAEERREEKADGSDAIGFHGHLAEEKT